MTHILYDKTFILITMDLLNLLKPEVKWSSVSKFCSTSFTTHSIHAITHLHKFLFLQLQQHAHTHTHTHTLQNYALHSDRVFFIARWLTWQHMTSFCTAMMMLLPLQCSSQQ